MTVEMSHVLSLASFIFFSLIHIQMIQIAPNVSLPESEARSSVVLKTSDGRRYACPREIVVGSLLIREILEEDADAPHSVELPLPAIDSKCLASVHEYLEHYSGVGRHRDIERPLRADLSSIIEPWDWKYVCDTLLQGRSERGVDHLIAVMSAANYLQIPSLRDLCGAALANVVRNKSEEEILSLFGISEPFTREQEEQLCRDFPWLKE
jgi:S-phase kinase-associated protein 1